MAASRSGWLSKIGSRKMRILLTAGIAGVLAVGLMLGFASVGSATTTTSIDITQPATDEVTSATVTIKWSWTVANTSSTAEIYEASYGPEGGPWTLIASTSATVDTETSGTGWVTWDSTEVSDGQYQIRVNEKNEDFVDTSGVFTVDNTAPSEVSLTTPVSPTSKDTPEFTVSATDATTNIIKIEYLVDGGSWTEVTGITPSTSVTSTFTVSLTDGLHAISARATDAASNTTPEASYGTTSIIVDATQPIVSISAPSIVAVSAPSITINATDVTTGISGVVYEVVSGSTVVVSHTEDLTATYPTTWTTTYTDALPDDGAYTISTEVTDKVGNITAKTTSIKFDTTPPIIDWVTKPTPRSSSGVFYVAATDATTAVSTIEYQVVGVTPWTASGVVASPSLSVSSTVASFDTAWLFPAPTDRTVEVQVRAADKLANTATPPIQYEYRYDTIPPTAQTAWFTTDKIVKVPFSEPVASPSGPLFAASAGGTAISGSSATVTEDDETVVQVTLESSAPISWLTGGAELLIDTGATVDLAGNPISAATVAIDPDETPPQYTKGEFVDNNTAYVYFNEALSAISHTKFTADFEITSAVTTGVRGKVELTLSGLTATLQSEGAYVNLASGAVVDLAGNGIALATEWISADTTKPQLASIAATPPVVSSQTVQFDLGFSEKMDASINPLVVVPEVTVVSASGWNTAATGWTGTLTPSEGQIASFDTVQVYGAKDFAGVKMAASQATVSTRWIVNRGPDIDITGPTSAATTLTVDTEPVALTSDDTPTFAITTAIPDAASGSGVSLDTVSIEFAEVDTQAVIATYATTGIAVSTWTASVSAGQALTDDVVYQIKVDSADELGNLSTSTVKFRVDTEPPSCVSAKFVGMNQMAVVFSEALSTVDRNKFTLGSGSSITDSDISGDTVLLDVELTTPDLLDDGDTLNISAGAVSDIARNPMATATVSVAPDDVKPTVTSITRTPGYDPISAATIEVTVNFSEEMDVRTTPQVTLVSVDAATEKTVTGDWSDVTTWTGEVAVDSTNEEENYIRVSGAVDFVGNEMILYGAEESDHFRVDTTKPEVVSVTVIPDPVPAGTQSIIFSVTFDESVSAPDMSFGQASPYTAYAVSVQPGGKTYTGIFEPSESLAAGTYHLSISGAADNVGNVMDPDTSYTFQVIAPKVEKNIGKSGGSLELPGIASIDIPKDALGSTQRISIEMLSSVPESAPDDTYRTPAGLYVQFGPAGLVFNKPVTIVIHYDEDVVADMGLTEADLTLYVWDGVEWRRIGGTVDTAANTITVKVNHFSIFGVVEDTTPAPSFKVSVSRNPFLSGEGTYFSYSLPKEGKVTLKIYDATGDKVKTLLDGVTREAGRYEGEVAWKGYNDFGNFVGSGIYIYKLKVEYTSGGSDEKVDTVGVIK